VIIEFYFYIATNIFISPGGRKKKKDCWQKEYAKIFKAHN